MLGDAPCEPNKSHSSDCEVNPASLLALFSSSGFVCSRSGWSCNLGLLDVRVGFGGSFLRLGGFDETVAGSGAALAFFEALM